MIIRSLLIFTILMTPLSTIEAAEAVSIGTVLPLSGKFGVFGNKALRGIELALEKYNSTVAGKKRPVRLLIKDSMGMPNMAGKAVSELNTDGVAVIIGPILAATADSAAKKAQELKIPIITMTQKEGITDIGGWVFRNGISSKAQVKSLADFASRQGINKIAVLYPDNLFGLELTVAFITEIANLGGEIVATKDYREGQTDFGLEIKALVGSDFLEKMKIYTEEREKEFKEEEKDKDVTAPMSEIEPFEEVEEEEMEKPIPDFDAIFIPDYADRVGLIIPQLAYYDVKDIKLLGISGWNSQKLLNMAGKFLNENVIIVDGFFSGSSRPQVIDFVGTYRKTFDEEPGIVEALAYDTMGIVLSIISEGSDSRGEIMDNIFNISNYQGVSGNITFSGNDVERSYYYLTVNSGVMEEVTGH